jgi:hypothetical protein
VTFAVFWGDSLTGMLREGLQAWVLVLFVVVALQQAHAGFSWLRSKPIRAILALRPVELLLIAVGPALATGQGLVGSGFTLNDVVALAAMLGFATGLAALVWSATPQALGGAVSEAPFRGAAPTARSGSPPDSAPSPATHIER